MTNKIYTKTYCENYNFNIELFKNYTLITCINIRYEFNE